MPHFLFRACTLISVCALARSAELEISGVRPGLCAFNNNGECGIGAIVPWAEKLWWITYPPHLRHGSSDKLYSIDEHFALTIHPESVGGTHANRLIHRESNQLFIGPYVIDGKGAIRVFNVKSALPGRLTATARHPLDPLNKVIFVDMEGPVWEADVRTLETKKLFEKALPGWHGKGAYTGQGRLIVSNNGEVAASGDLDKTKITADLKPHGPEDAGVLGEWDGTEWRIVERREFTDVTGPGGIYGNEKDSDPVWAIGWDKRSVLLKLLDHGKWSTFRLPKSDYGFDPKHGWYTEWPRIREIGDGKMLAIMHGGIFDFPKTFSAANAAGIRPIATHLRYIPDFCVWNHTLVLAEDSTTIMPNPLAGQSQSNLWFGSLDEVKQWGPPQGWGGPWLGDAVSANESSIPYLFAGYGQRMVHLAHNAGSAVTFIFETDTDGVWSEIAREIAPAKGYAFHVFPAAAPGEFIRVRTDKDCPAASCYFHYLPATYADGSARATLFKSLALADGGAASPGGIIRPAGHNRNLQQLAGEHYSEVDETLATTVIRDSKLAGEVKTRAGFDTALVSEDAASFIVHDPAGKVLRLPKSPQPNWKNTTPSRTLREVMSERFLANIGGTFYEVPRAEKGEAGSNGLAKHDFRRMKALASHPFAIVDFCSWRGLLVLSGTKKEAAADGHFFSGADGAPGLWYGVADDLFKLGKPTGVGGPWMNTAVRAGEPSDAYLMTNFDRKSLELTHDSAGDIEFQIEIDYSNRDFWKPYATVTVKQGEDLHHSFPPGYAAHWVRLTPSKDCKATAIFRYE